MKKMVFLFVVVLLVFCIVAVALIGCVLFRRAPVVSCISCGAINDCACGTNERYDVDGCSCRIACSQKCHVDNCPFDSIGVENFAYYSVAFMSDGERLDVKVPIDARYWDNKGIDSWYVGFSRRLKMPKCDSSRRGFVFDKWQQVGATSNAMFSVGEKVTISSNTTFIATWKPEAIQ